MARSRRSTVAVFALNPAASPPNVHITDKARSQLWVPAWVVGVPLACEPLGRLPLPSTHPPRTPEEFWRLYGASRHLSWDVGPGRR